MQSFFFKFNLIYLFLLKLNLYLTFLKLKLYQTVQSRCIHYLKVNTFIALTWFVSLWSQVGDNCIFQHPITGSEVLLWMKVLCCKTTTSAKVFINISLSFKFISQPYRYSLLIISLVLFIIRANNPIYDQLLNYNW